MTKLYEMPEEFERAYRVMVSDADVTEEQLAEALNEIDGRFKEKVENCAKVLTELSATSGCCQVEATRLNKRATTINRRIDWLRDYVRDNMVRMDMREVDGDLFRVSVQKNPHKVVVEDEAKIPDSYYVPQEPRLSKTAVKADLVDGKEVPGCSLTQTESLRIR